MSWRTASLEDICVFIRNGKSIQQSKDEDGLPITRIETIANQSIDEHRVGYAGVTEDEVGDHLLQTGDILFSHINSLDHLGKTAIYEGRPRKLVHGMNLLNLRPDQAVAIPGYLLHVLRAPQTRAKFQRIANKSVNQASISVGNLKKVTVSLPPLAEQRRIAAILDKADALRAKRRETIAKLDQLLQSVFLDMFGDPVTNPKGWDLRAVGEVIIHFVGGKNIACPDESTSPYRILKVSAVTTKTFRPNESKPAPDDFAPAPEAMVKQGDLLFSRANTTELVAATAYVWDTPSNLVLPDKIWRLEIDPSARIEKLYLWELFKNAAFRDELSKRSSGTSGSMKNISKSKLRSVLMPLPPIELQNRFASICKKAYLQMEDLTSSLTGIEVLFSGLQTRAFAGTL